AALKKRNRAERDQGQLSLGEAGLELPIAELAAAVFALEQADDIELQHLHSKERQHESILKSNEYRRSRLIADAWVAAFVAKKVANAPEMTGSTLRTVATHPQGASGAVV